MHRPCAGRRLPLLGRSEQGKHFRGLASQDSEPREATWPLLPKMVGNGREQDDSSTENK